MNLYQPTWDLLTNDRYINTINSGIILIWTKDIFTIWLAPYKDCYSVNCNQIKDRIEKCKEKNTKCILKESIFLGCDVKFFYPSLP